nr:hypothetical protein CFP56_62241 [Quercus suber]
MFQILFSDQSWVTIIGAVCGDPTLLEALSKLRIVQLWKVYMLERVLQEETNQGPSQGVVGGKKGSPHHNDRLRELENLWKQVNDLEIKLRGRNCRRDWEDSFDDLDYIADKSSRGSGSR